MTDEDLYLIEQNYKSFQDLYKRGIITDIQSYGGIQLPEKQLNWLLSQADVKTNIERGDKWNYPYEHQCVVNGLVYFIITKEMV